MAGLLYLWRRHRANKQAEEERKQELEEYGFNPNNDPSLPTGGAYADTRAMRDSDAGGYRGWGNTAASHSHKPSTNLSSGGQLSDHGAPSAGSPEMQHTYDEDDAIGGLPTRHSDYGGVAAAATAAGAAAGNTGDIHRGPSNASSAYSAAAHSDMSDDVMQHSAGNPYFDAGYGGYANPAGIQGGYGEVGGYGGAGAYDGGYDTQNPYGGVEPVIRDVSARRDTRIVESPAAAVPQGNAGISQNF